MNFDPNTYELVKDYCQRQEQRAAKARLIAEAQKNNRSKSASVIRVISQVLVNLK